ncbi:MAG: TolC family protein [Kofleriaceae bacterium]
MKSIGGVVFATVLTMGATGHAQPARSQPPAQPSGQAETLTLARAIELALKQQPSVRQTAASIEASRARVDQAKVAQRPTIGLSASASVGSTPPRPCDTDPTMTCGGFFDPSTSTGLGAVINWRIFDFGQTGANIRAAEASAQAVASQVATNTLDIQSRVSVTYLEAVARQRLVGVSEATVKSELAHLDQARKFVAAQAKDPIEVAQAQSRAANARSALAQAQSNAAVALANLRAAIGWLDPNVTFGIDTTWPIPPEQDPEALGTLVSAARKSRPELIQLDKQIVAAEASLTAAQAERRPVLNATASTQWGPDSSDWSPEPSWAAGLTLSWQLYDGGRSSADVRLSRANLTAAIAERDALLVSLNSEVDSARTQIIAHRANVQASNEAVTAARAQLKLADARYVQGLGSQIELADAQTAVTLAEGNLISAEWQLADAWAQLRRALGQR